MMQRKLLTITAILLFAVGAQARVPKPIRPRPVATKPGTPWSERDFIQAADTHKTNLCQNALWVDIGTGTGSVTSVSANGISGTVANSTITPALTLAWGAITPTSVTATIQGPINDKGGQVFNVKTYGAVCDGATADTTAITTADAAAVAAGGSLYLPPSKNGCKIGTATIASPIAANGGSLTLTTGQTTTFTGFDGRDVSATILFRNAQSGQGVASFSGNRVLSELRPEWWGAKGDSTVTDNAPPVSATFAAAKTVTLPTSRSGGVTVRFGVGEYLFNSGVTYSSGKSKSIVIKGEGFSTVFVAGHDMTLLTVDNGTSSHQGMLISGIQFYLNNQDAAAIDMTHGGQWARFEHLWVMGPLTAGTKPLISVGSEVISMQNVLVEGQDDPTNGNVGIYLTHVPPYRIYLQNVEVYYCNKGISVDRANTAGTNFVIRDSTIFRNTTGIDIGGTGTGVAEVNWLIEGNSFESNITDINLNGFSSTFPLRNVTIADNYFTGIDTGYTGISAKNVDGLSIVRNYFTSHAAADTGGIALSFTSGITRASVSGNTSTTTPVTYSPSMTIVNNATAGPSSGPVFPSALLTTNQVSIDSATAVNALSNLTSNGFVKTGGGIGTLSVDTTSYLPITGGTLTGSSTAAFGTAANRYVFGIPAPTLTSTNATVTDTVASTVYIGGAPAAGTNTTIGTAWALNVAAGNTNHGGGVTVGGGTLILRHISATATLDFAKLAAIGCEDLTMTITGAALGDSVALGVPNGSVVANGNFTAWISSAGTATVRFCTVVSGDPASGVFRIDAWQH
jgi:hypothetical protein